MTNFSLRQKLLKTKGSLNYIISRNRKTYFNFSKESLDHIFKKAESKELRKFIYDNKFKIQNDLQEAFENYFEMDRKMDRYLEDQDNLGNQELRISKPEVKAFLEVFFFIILLTFSGNA